MSGIEAFESDDPKNATLNTFPKEYGNSNFCNQH